MWRRGFELTFFLLRYQLVIDRLFINKHFSDYKPSKFMAILKLSKVIQNYILNITHMSPAWPACAYYQRLFLPKLLRCEPHWPTSWKLKVYSFTFTESIFCHSQYNFWEFPSELPQPWSGIISSICSTCPSSHRCGTASSGLLLWRHRSAED